MLVRWTQPAADDLLHICDYTAGRFDAAVAHRVADAIFETAASLQDMPNRGRKGRKPNTREMLISGSRSSLFTASDEMRLRSPGSCILRSNGLNHHEGAKNPLRNVAIRPFDIRAEPTPASNAIYLAKISPTRYSIGPLALPFPTLPRFPLSDRYGADLLRR